jgi:hypothetical protein
MQVVVSWLPSKVCNEGTNRSRCDERDPGISSFKVLKGSEALRVGRNARKRGGEEEKKRKKEGTRERMGVFMGVWGHCVQSLLWTSIDAVELTVKMDFLHDMDTSNNRGGFAGKLVGVCHRRGHHAGGSWLGIHGELHLLPLARVESGILRK